MLSRATVVLVLLLLSATQQWRLIARAPLPAQDAVEFVAVAQRMMHDGVATTVGRESVAPLFPFTVYRTYLALTDAGLIDRAEWGRAAQIAAAIPLILAVVPVYLLSLRLAGRDAGLIAAILFCLLPATSRLGTDGISDSLHLCCAAWGLWALVVASEQIGRRALGWWLLSGAMVGAAILCRAETLIVIAAVGLAMLFAPRTRGLSAATFACGCLVCLIPYLQSGVTEPAAIAERLRGGGTASTDRPVNATSFEFEDRRLVGPPVAEAASLYHEAEQLEFGRKDRSRSIRVHGFVAAIVLYTKELFQACGYVVLPLALFGAWSLRGGARHPSFTVLGCFTLLYFVVSLVFAVRQGYVTSRHFLLPLLTLLPLAGAGLIELAALLRTKYVALRTAEHHVADLARGLTVALTGACLIATLRPPHYTHVAQRRAADWLSSGAAERGIVLDQHGWTGLFTGRPTYSFEAAESVLLNEALRYVVVDRVDLEADSRRAKSLRAVLGSADGAVACFPDDRGRTEHDVLIFHRSKHLVAELKQSSGHARLLYTAQRETRHAQ